MSLIARDTPREIKFTTGINPYALSSVIVEFGNTKVHITATLEESVPPWMKGSGKGWVTAEYSMLPGATHTRGRRERGKIGGRTYEIQRLIGRSLRSVVDLEKMGELSIQVDCDVLVADGGTRTASISGAYVALALGFKRLISEGKVEVNPLLHQLGAISVGINKEGRIIADLNYDEDSTCETDMNVVMTRTGEFVELQGTAEEKPFKREQLDALLKAAESSLQTVFTEQDKAIS